MKYGNLSENEKELRQGVIIVTPKELTLILLACEEYSKIHPRQITIKNIIKDMRDIPIY